MVKNKVLVFNLLFCTSILSFCSSSKFTVTDTRFYSGPKNLVIDSSRLPKDDTEQRQKPGISEDLLNQPGDEQEKIRFLNWNGTPVTIAYSPLDRRTYLELLQSVERMLNVALDGCHGRALGMATTIYVNIPQDSSEVTVMTSVARNSDGGVFFSDRLK